jgi:hypothetical protein
LNTTLDFALATTLRRDGRYIVSACGRGGTLPTVLAMQNNEAPITWMGMSSALGYAIGGELWTRANAAFPNPYNGAFTSVGATYGRLILTFTLP